jgi:hypothetical protein
MEWTDAFRLSGAGATVAIAIAIVYKLGAMLINHRLRSECCDREATMGISVENMGQSPRPEVAV